MACVSSTFAHLDRSLEGSTSSSQKASYVAMPVPVDSNDVVFETPITEIKSRNHLTIDKKDSLCS